MNASFTRNKQNHTALYWEPFATSTPLKALPNNLEIGQVFQKQLILHGAPFNVVEKLQNGFTNPLVLQNKRTGSNFPERTRKNSSAYFDILTTSSSDEDDSGKNKKRPVIKLSSRKRARTMLSFKKLGSEETEILNKSNPENKLSNYKKLKRTTDRHVISAVKDFRQKSQSPKGKDEVWHPTPRSRSISNSKSFSSDEENKIFDEPKSCKKTMSTVKSCLNNKENGIKIASVNGNLGKHEEKGLKGLHEMSNTQAKSSKGGISKEEKDACKTIFEDNKAIKTPKKKVKKLTNTIDPIKRTRSRKIPDKLPAESSEPVGNAETLLPSWKRNHNLSHQLFSDSREQEFINMLDLTREEGNEAVQATKCSGKEPENDLLLKSFMSPHPSIQNICSNKIEPERPKRTKQIPKKFWLPENAPDKPLHVVAAKKQKMRVKSNDPTHEAEVLKKLKEASTSNSELKNKAGREHASAKRQKSEKKGKKAEKEIAEPYVLNINGVKLEDTEQNHLPSKTHKSTDVESNQNSFAITKDGDRINLDRPVFKRLNELSNEYKVNETGCSVDQCWNLNNFKCGIFRQKIKTQFACKTLHKNSYLGGVLVKGDLRMKIGDKDLHLKEGDMAFVPPLTKWQATNIGDCESVFYYWCGRFTG